MVTGSRSARHSLGLTWPLASVAVAAVVGCWLARPVPGAAVIWLASSAVVAAAITPRRRPWARPPVVTVVLGLVAIVLGFSWWAERATAGLRWQGSRRIDGWVTLVDDPTPVGRATVVTVRWDRQRLQAWAHGGDARRLSTRRAGERIEVSGTVDPRIDAWLAVRHIAASAQLNRVGDWRPGAQWTVTTNRVRALYERGLAAANAPPLSNGLVIGDDRYVDQATRAQFRVAGLAHLTAASGQNVALVVAMAGPVLHRAPLRLRIAGTLAMITLLCSVTRFEPSILRAGTMAALAVSTTGGVLQRSRARLLTLSVIVLLVVDPLLVRSVGFALSVCATGGIVALASPIARWMRGPRWLVESIAVSLAAQLAVLPVTLAVFGTTAPAGPLANAAAGPAAAMVMTWGLAAGLVAGALPGLAWLIHLPVVVGTWWVQSVASVAAAMPLMVAVMVQLALAGLVVRRPPAAPDR